MTRLTTLILSGAAILAIGVTAHASPDADTNQDGTITHSEFVTNAQLKFETADLDRDGYLSESEREQARTARRENKQAGRFDRLDANDDGIVSEDEFAAAAEMRGQRTRSDGDRSGRRGSRGPRKAKGSPQERLAEIDINGDGLVSFQEHMAGANVLFEKLDADQNGVLEQGEGRRRSRMGRSRMDRPSR